MNSGTLDNFIIGGDFNSHLKSWGSDKRSDIFNDYIMLNDLTIINDPVIPYTYREGDRYGTPDFTLSGQHVLNKINHWTVLLENNSDSYHLYITFSIILTLIENTFYR